MDHNRLMRLILLLVVAGSAAGSPMHAGFSPIPDIPAAERAFDGTLSPVGSVDARPTVYGKPSGEIVLLSREDWRLLARRSADGGTTFGAETPLGGSSPPDVLDYDAAWDGGSAIYVAMIVADPTGGVGLRFTRSDDMGATWSDPVVVVDDMSDAHGVRGVRIVTGPSGSAAIGIRGNAGRDAFVAATSDQGATWTQPVRIDSGVAAGTAEVPSIDVAVDGAARIHAVFTQDRGSGARVYVSRSTDGGSTFSPETEVPLATSGNSTNPDIAVAQDGNLLLALIVASSGTHLYVLRSTDQGSTFTTVLDRVSANGAAVPVLVIDPATPTTFVHYVETASELALDRSANAGATWAGSPIVLTSTSSVLPKLPEPESGPGAWMRRTAADTWVVAWTDRRSDTYGQVRTDVYARATTNDGVSFGTAARVDSGAAGAAFSRLTGMTAYGANNVFLSYTDGRDEAGRSANVYGNRSAVPLSFGADSRLDADAGVQSPDVGIGCSIATDGAQHVYYAFTARDTGPFDDVYVTVSADSGATFGAPMRVGSLAAGARLNRNPILRALPDGHVYLLYQSDVAPASREFRFTRSTDFGATWSSPDKVVGSMPAVPGSDDDPRVRQRLEANEAGVVYVVWESLSQIVMARSTDFGATFAAAVPIDDDPYNSAVYPFVCASGTRLIVAYNAYDSTGTVFTLRARVSNTSGATFLPSTDLRPGLSGSFGVGDLGCGPSGTAVATWRDLRSGNGEYYARRFDGANWLSETLVASPSGVDLFDDDVEFSDATTVLAAYRDLTGAVYVARSLDGGATFPSYVRVDEVLADAAARSSSPRLATDGAGNAWIRFLDEGPELPAVVVRHSADGGATFGPALRMNREVPQGSRNNRGNGVVPLQRDVAAAGGIGHFGWIGQRSTFEEDALYNRWNGGDLDGDGTPSGSDCDDLNPDLWSVPVEVAGVSIERIGGGIRIEWTSQDATAGPATVYDLPTGSLDDLRGTGTFAASWCLVNGVADTPYDDFSVDPPPGSGRYYLVRGKSDCGSGTYGDSSLTPDPRDDLDAGLTCP